MNGLMTFLGVKDSPKQSLTCQSVLCTRPCLSTPNWGRSCQYGGEPGKVWILEERTGLGPVPQTGTLLARCFGHHEVRLLVSRLSGRFCHEGDYHIHPDPKGAGHYTPRTLAGLASEALFNVLGEEKPSSLRDRPGWA